MNTSLGDRIYAGLAGLYAGDAYGLPMEMMPREHVKQVFGRVDDLTVLERATCVEGFMYRPITPLGRGSDDTYFNTYVVEKYIQSGRMDEQATKEIFLDRLREIMDTPFYGPSTLAAINKLARGQDPSTTGLPSSPLGEAQSCGSATLRATPIGMANPGDPRNAAIEAARAALPTHGSAVALSAAAAWAAAVAQAMVDGSVIEEIYRASLLGADIGAGYGRIGIYASVKARIQAVWTLAQRIKDPDEMANECYDLIGAGLPANETVPTSLGIFFSAPDDMKKGLLAAINVGGDTDSTGSMVGALVGCYTGRCNLPIERLGQIEAANHIDIKDIAHRFSAWIAANRLA